MNRFRFFDWLGVLAVVLGACGPAWAQKGGKTNTPPLGAILFRYANEVLSCDGNGNNLTIERSGGVPPGSENWLVVGASVSNLRYQDGARWWLALIHDGTRFYDYVDTNGQPRSTPQYELYAYRRIGPNVTNPTNQFIRLTDFLADGIFVGSIGDVAWSNDGEDSFVSFSARPEVAPGMRANSIYALQLSGRDLDVIGAMELAAPGSFAPIRYAEASQPGAPFPARLAFVGLPIAGGSHQWSPAGNAVSLSDGDNGYVWREGDPSATLVATDPQYLAWSPTLVPTNGAERLLFHRAGYEILSSNLDGSDRRSVMQSSGKITWLYRGSWSPDAKHVVARAALAAGFDYKSIIVRIESSGDKRTFVDITPTNLDPYQDKDVFAWKSNASAYSAP